jgi:hypothetical protein
LIILLDNAIKFTPGGGTVDIRARMLPRDSGFLLFEVTDTGCGISPERRDRVFERLYQGSESGHGSRKGLGLGLYICKELVTRQGGQIWIEDRAEAGSVLAFTLPVFSLHSVMAPLLKNDRWPAESAALVIVESSVTGEPPSAESREEWSRDARDLLQRCLLPDLDVLLPTSSSDARRERLFAVAFTNEHGISVLVNRIQEQFEHLPHSKPAGANVSVFYEMLDPFPSDAGASSNQIVAHMAQCLDKSITLHSSSEGVPGE